MSVDLRLGDYRDVMLAPDGEVVGCVITDPPYSKRTHDGHDGGADMGNRKTGWMRKSAGRVDTPRQRRELSYAHWTADDVQGFVSFWAPRNAGWFVCLSDSDLCSAYRKAYESHGLTGFQPVPCVIPGMTCRMAGDGPSSWAVYANVGRPKSLHNWGTLPGAYVGKPYRQAGRNGSAEPGSHIGGKPEWLMRALVRDYSKPGDVVCDPCAGYGTTAKAALGMGRGFCGAEVDPKTYAEAIKSLGGGIEMDLFEGRL